MENLQIIIKPHPKGHLHLLTTGHGDQQNLNVKYSIQNIIRWEVDYEYSEFIQLHKLVLKYYSNILTTEFPKYPKKGLFLYKYYYFDYLFLFDVLVVMLLLS